MIENSSAGLVMLGSEVAVTVTREDRHQDVLARYPVATGMERRVAVELAWCTVDSGKYRGQPAIEVRLDGWRAGELTHLMSQRYGTLVSGVTFHGGRPGCEAVIQRGARGLEIVLRLPRHTDTAAFRPVSPSFPVGVPSHPAGPPAAYPGHRRPPTPPRFGPPPVGSVPPRSARYAPPPAVPVPPSTPVPVGPPRRSGSRRPLWIAAAVVAVIFGAALANGGDDPSTTTTAADATTTTAAPTTAPATTPPATTPPPATTAPPAVPAVPAPTPEPAVQQPPQPAPQPPQPAVPKPAPPKPAPQPACHPNYSGCVPVASDVDCAGGSGDGPAYVSGPIRVTGADVYRLDADKDGIACE